MRNILNQITKDEADVAEYKKYAQHMFVSLEMVVSDELSKGQGDYGWTDRYQL